MDGEHIYAGIEFKAEACVYHEQYMKHITIPGFLGLEFNTLHTLKFLGLSSNTLHTLKRKNQTGIP
jgi:hypothetical protein